MDDDGRTDRDEARDAASPAGGERPQPGAGRPGLAAKVARALAIAADVAALRLGQARRRYELLDAALEAADLDRSRAGGLLAGGIAFRAFVWLLPAALLCTGVLGLVRQYSQKSPETLAKSVGLAGVIGNAVGTASAQSHTATAVLIGLGAVLTVYTGIGLVRALRVAYVLAWGLPLERRPGLVADGTLFSLALIVQLSLSGLGAWVRSASTLGGVGAVVATPLAGAAIWLWIAWRLPHAETPLRALLPGTLLIGVGLEVLQFVTVYYFSHRLGSAPRLYGSLGIAATLLAWLYLIARLVVAAAFLNATLWYRRNPREAAAPAG
jgi:membrane protein